MKGKDVGEADKNHNRSQSDVFPLEVKEIDLLSTRAPLSDTFYFILKFDVVLGIKPKAKCKCPTMELQPQPRPLKSHEP